MAGHPENGAETNEHTQIPSVLRERLQSLHPKHLLQRSITATPGRGSHGTALGNKKAGKRLRGHLLEGEGKGEINNKLLQFRCKSDKELCQVRKPQSRDA